MKLRFTKMQGAGNDFVVLDATRQRIELSAEQFRRLGDRHFGVGADQILIVDPSPAPGIDFGYRIFNNSGDEVEHCGNGARCFVRYVREKGLTTKQRISVQTVNRRIELHWQEDGRVTVDMGAPRFAHEQVPFNAQGLLPQRVQACELWPLELIDNSVAEGRVEVAVLSMGNPHAVMQVSDVDTTDVVALGAEVEVLDAFPQQVNVGFMQVLNREAIKLRVFERGAGETLACGTGACAAVVAGIQQGLLAARVDVHMRGGNVTIAWAGPGEPVLMTGPAQTVFEGEIEL